MSNLAVIENKISTIKKYLKILDGYKKYSKEEIENDLNIKGAVERYLYLAAQATIDLAEAVIAYKKFRKPSTMAESFYILQEEGVISAELAAKMVGMTGFRNTIAHDYEKINYDLVYKIIQHDVKDIEEFVKIISVI
ncbi:MAG: DUF86 domain-containing protein [Candidatus Pacebacteria bacterium]|nr:DUF86 domain-containing protein [Candidatus Paceibacterota bacterium]